MKKGKTKSKWATIKKWCCNRLREKSTWLGILGILTAFCILPFDESTTGYVATFLGSLGGLIGVLWQEKDKTQTSNAKKKTSASKKKSGKPKVVTFDDSDDKATISYKD